MFDQINGKRILVTGASRGLGARIATGLAREGAHLVLAARDAGKMQAVARDCEAAGAEVTLVSADLCLADDRVRLLAEAGAIDILVNNAGVEITIGLVEQTAADVKLQLDTNLLAPIELTRLLLPKLIARGSGAVVNVSSMSGKSATPYNSIYAAAKHGLNGFTSSLAIELHGTGVHVGVVCPSFVADAGMWSETGVKAPRSMREVSPADVVAGVLRVIGGEGEVLVTPTPVRPLLAFRELFPRLEGPIMRAMGVVKVLGERADWARSKR